MTQPLPELPEDSLGLTQERFGFTMFMSLCLHAMLILGVGFTIASQPRATTLDITLAQSSSDKAPNDADFLAQANQEGSGSLDDKLAPATDVEAQFSDSVIRDVSRYLTERPTVAPQQNDSVIARQSDNAPATADARNNETDTAKVVEEPAQVEPVIKNIASLQAQLDLHRQADANRPRHYTMTTASTKQAADALYLDNWRKRVEGIGNINYPSRASAEGIYGTLRLMVSLKPDGSIHDIRILRSSGEPVLDEAAVRIVLLAAPFDPFPPEMRERVDVLDIIRTWQFHRGNRFSSF